MHTAIVLTYFDSISAACNVVPYSPFSVRRKRKKPFVMLKGSCFCRSLSLDLSRKEMDVVFMQKTSSIIVLLVAEPLT